MGLEGDARISRRFDGLRRVASNCERIIIRFRELIRFGKKRRENIEDEYIVRKPFE